MLWKRIHSQLQGRARRNAISLLILDRCILFLRRGKVAQVQGASSGYLWFAKWKRKISEKWKCAKFMFSKRFVDRQAVGVLNLLEFAWFKYTLCLFTHGLSWSFDFYYCKIASDEHLAAEVRGAIVLKRFLLKVESLSCYCSFCSLCCQIGLEVEVTLYSTRVVRAIIWTAVRSAWVRRVSLLGLTWGARMFVASCLCLLPRRTWISLFDVWKWGVNLHRLLMILALVLL